MTRLGITSLIDAIEELREKAIYQSNDISVTQATKLGFDLIQHDPRESKYRLFKKDKENVLLVFKGSTLVTVLVKDDLFGQTHATNKGRYDVTQSKKYKKIQEVRNGTTI